ncbi:MAG TPA: biopolymer transporter ExbD [Campylobacterales bacterium]|nr:biopolymer transporter ExbD [Campylobacterales bacterium]
MKRREHIAPDLTPLIDVVFLILIFFMVSSTFKKEELALLLTLPDANSATQEIKKEELNIELTKDEVALKGKAISFEELDTSFLKVEDKLKPINVRIDKDVTYERVVKLLDLLNKHGLNNLALENKKEEK